MSKIGDKLRLVAFIAIVILRINSLYSYIFSEELKMALEKKQKCNAQALEIVEALLEPKIDPMDFLDKVE